jgi:hypothetical protein
MGILEEKLAAPQAARAVHIFTFSPEIQKELGVTSVGLHELTIDEELAASQRANSSPFRLAYEMPKQALVEVDGQPVSLADGSADIAWSKLSPRARQFVMTAYSKIHNATEDEAKVFLQSQTVRVG